eukprot:TRINITY_DN4107_c0_g1_i1.p1 TRINITY_DN4107_c0_g1~~TRINITY_DN4107_c0_g1_i1.p1  ORF type:complete len:706 (-),score=138.26 TRINITY_DN4107_c0_g1_i1:28-2145(-)
MDGAPVMIQWESDGPAGWVEKLGLLKECEMRRRSSFLNWAESARAALEVEKRGARSAHLLVAAVCKQVKERAEADEASSRQLVKIAGRRDVAEFSKAKTSVWTDDDRAQAGYLTSMTRYCAQHVCEGSRAVRSGLEKSDSLRRCRALRGTMENLFETLEKEIACTEKVAEACTARWDEHEGVCRRRLQPDLPRRAGAGKLTVDLWLSEKEYRRIAEIYYRKVRSCIAQMAKLRPDIAAHVQEHRALAQQMIREATQRWASTYGELSRTLALPPGGGLPNLPNNIPASSRSRNTPLPPRLPVPTPSALPEIELPELPASAHILCQSAVEQPPFLFGGWRRAHVLATTDGCVHLFSRASDVSSGDPIWTIKPGKVTLDVELKGRKLIFRPLPGCLPGRRLRVVRFPTPESLTAWRTSLERWWPEQQPEAPLALAAAVAAPGDAAAETMPMAARAPATPSTAEMAAGETPPPTRAVTVADQSSVGAGSPPAATVSRAPSVQHDEDISDLGGGSPAGTSHGGLARSAVGSERTSHGDLARSAVGSERERSAVAEEAEAEEVVTFAAVAAADAGAADAVSGGGDVASRSAATDDQHRRAAVSALPLAARGESPSHAPSSAVSPAEKSSVALSEAQAVEADAPSGPPSSGPPVLLGRMAPPTETNRKPSLKFNPLPRVPAQQSIGGGSGTSSASNEVPAISASNDVPAISV